MTLMRSRVEPCAPYANQCLIAQTYANLGWVWEGEGACRIAKIALIGQLPKLETQSSSLVYTDDTD